MGRTGFTIEEVAGLQTALDGKQSVDVDLTAIAALTTQAFGRSVLTTADAAALRDLAGLASDDTATFQRVELIGSNSGIRLFNRPTGTAGFEWYVPNIGTLRLYDYGTGTNIVDITSNGDLKPAGKLHPGPQNANVYAEQSNGQFIIRPELRVYNTVGNGFGPGYFSDLVATGTIASSNVTLGGPTAPDFISPRIIGATFGGTARTYSWGYACDTLAIGSGWGSGFPANWSTIVDISSAGMVMRNSVPLELRNGTWGIGVRLRSLSNSNLTIDDYNGAAATVNLTGSLLASGRIVVGSLTYGTLPSASANTGAIFRLSDRGQKHVYSDGTNWLWMHDSTIAS